MENFLERMSCASRERATNAARHVPLPQIIARAESAPAPLPLRLHEFDLIAELKLRSPAMGDLAKANFDPNAQLDAYAAGGAAAVSVLTEPEAFKGELAHLQNAAMRLRPAGVGVMRKDFLVDSYQVIEARAHGASGVLLIAAMLDDAALTDLLATAQSLGLFVLIEAFDAEDLERIARLGFDTDRSTVLVGVNSRNLKTLAVDFERFQALANQIRDDVPAVAESGIESPADIEAVARYGYRLALVGGALMRQDATATAVAQFITAGRSARKEMAACS